MRRFKMWEPHGATTKQTEDVEMMLSGISSNWSVAWSPGNHYSMLEPLVTDIHDKLEQALWRDILIQLEIPPNEYKQRS